MSAAEMWQLAAAPDADVVAYLRAHQPGCWEIMLGENPLRQGETVRRFRLLLMCGAEALDRAAAASVPR